jgi:hypothetical protein
MWHHPMQHDQGYIRSNWTPPSGDYMIRIASAATRATINKTMMQHVATLMAISIVMAVGRYYTLSIAQWKRFMAFIKATKCRHQASTRSDITQSDTQRRLIPTFHRRKRAPIDMLAPNNNRGMTYQTDQRHLNNLLENFVGVIKISIYC